MNLSLDCQLTTVAGKRVDLVEFVQLGWPGCVGSASASSRITGATQKVVELEGSAIDLAYSTGDK